MDGTVTSPDRASFGEIRIEEAEDVRFRPTENADEITHRRSKYTWHPPEELTPLLPDAFQLSMQCVTGSDGVRRFFPWNGFELFLALASEGGLAILTQRENLNAEYRHSYRIMRLFFLRVLRSAEFLDRGFEYASDLRVVQSGREILSERDVLPDDLGLDPQGNGTHWNVRTLMDQGKTAARAAGCSSPTAKQFIHYGFIQAARLNPLSVPESQVPLLIRNALFIESADEPDKHLLEIVTDRLQAALHTHLDEPHEAFEKWYLGRNNSLVHQLAKQKGSPGGRLEVSEVRNVLVHLGWRAYQYASDCIRAQMRTFQNALSHSLSDRERLLFENMHLPQHYLGGLPLVLVMPRFRFIRRVLLEVWEQLPNASMIPVLHRMLRYYATLITRRREADRRIKRQPQAEFDDGAYVPQTESDFFQQIASEIREIRRIDCGCPRRDWHSELIGRGRAEIRILHRCFACSFQMETVLTAEEFRRIGEQIR